MNSRLKIVSTVAAWPSQFACALRKDSAPSPRISLPLQPGFMLFPDRSGSAAVISRRRRPSPRCDRQTNPAKHQAKPGNHPLSSPPAKSSRQGEARSWDFGVFSCTRRQRGDS